MKILIVDDHLLFADVLAIALTETCTQIEKANCAEAAYTALQDTSFDLVLLDLNLPDIHGEVVLSTIKQSQPSLKVIIVSAAKVDINRIRKLGANGFINKSQNIDSMLSAIERVAMGQDYYPAGQLGSIEEATYSVTPRQMEIVRAMSEGYANKQIAHQLNISEGTVKQQINRIFRVLDVKNRTQCIRKAGELGLISERHSV